MQSTKSFDIQELGSVVPWGEKEIDHMSSLLTLSEANESVLAGLPEPKDLWKWFLLLSQQPRVPEHCEKVKEWLMVRASKTLEVTVSRK